MVWRKRHELAEDVLRKIQTTSKLYACANAIIIVSKTCIALYCSCFVSSKKRLAYAKNIFPLWSTTKKNVKATKPASLLYNKQYKRSCCLLLLLDLYKLRFLSFLNIVNILIINYIKCKTGRDSVYALCWQTTPTRYIVYRWNQDILYTTESAFKKKANLWLRDWWSTHWSDDVQRQCWCCPQIWVYRVKTSHVCVLFYMLNGGMEI